MDRQLEEFAGSFGNDVAKIFQEGGDKMEERLLRAVEKHEHDLAEWMARFTDPAFRHRPFRPSSRGGCAR